MATLVGQRTQLQNRIHSVLAMRLIIPPSDGDSNAGVRTTNQRPTTGSQKRRQTTPSKPQKYGSAACNNPSGEIIPSRPLPEVNHIVPINHMGFMGVMGSMGFMKHGAEDKFQLPSKAAWRHTSISAWT